MPLSDTDKIVAATLAAAKATAMGCLTAEDYIAEYQGFLYHFEMQAQFADRSSGDPLVKPVSFDMDPEPATA